MDLIYISWHHFSPEMFFMAAAVNKDVKGISLRFNLKSNLFMANVDGGKNMLSGDKTDGVNVHKVGKCVFRNKYVCGGSTVVIAP
jgi:hypothetical protein